MGPHDPGWETSRRQNQSPQRGAPYCAGMRIRRAPHRHGAAERWTAVSPFGGIASSRPISECTAGLLDPRSPSPERRTFRPNCPPGFVPASPSSKRGIPARGQSRPARSLSVAEPAKNLLRRLIADQASTTEPPNREQYLAGSRPLGDVSRPGEPPSEVAHATTLLFGLCALGWTGGGRWT